MVAIQFAIIYNNNGEINKMHDSVYRTENGYKNASNFVHVNMIVQGQECAKTTRS